MSELVREDPPTRPTARLAVRYAAELAKVRAQPGEWFRMIDYTAKASKGSSNNTVFSQASTAASCLRSQTNGFEFRATQGRVYVRWIGTEAAS